MAVVIFIFGGDCVWLVVAEEGADLSLQPRVAMKVKATMQVRERGASRIFCATELTIPADLVSGISFASSGDIALGPMKIACLCKKFRYPRTKRDRSALDLKIRTSCVEHLAGPLFMNAAWWIDLCQGPKAFLHFSDENPV